MSKHQNVKKFQNGKISKWSISKMPSFQNVQTLKMATKLKNRITD